jgi:hypothetical protein
LLIIGPPTALTRATAVRLALRRQVVKIGSIGISQVALTLIVCVLCVSCLGLEMETRFNPDGSGETTIRFRISQTMLQMSEEDVEAPVPLTREELEETYANVEGVRILEITEEESDGDRIVTARLAFDDFNAFAQSDDFPGEGASLVRRDGRTVYRAQVGTNTEDMLAQTEGEQGEQSEAERAEAAEMEEAMQAMVMSFMEGYFLEYRVVAPSRIQSHTHGDLSPDGRTVTIRVPMGDLVMLDEPFTMEVVW